MEIIHRFLGIIVILIGIILTLAAELTPTTSAVVKGFLGNAGTSFLALGMLELIFKSYLQKDLTSSVVIMLQKATSQPFDAAYLGRAEIPNEKDVTNLLAKAKSIVFLKAISFTGAVGSGLINTIESVLRSNSKVNIRVLIFDPNSSLLEQIALLTSLNSLKVRQDIQQVMEHIQTLQKKYGQRVGYRLYDSVPTCAMVMIDPDSLAGYLRIEPYLYNGQSAMQRINLFLSRKQNQAYFDEIYQAIKKEWRKSQERE